MVQRGAERWFRGVPSWFRGVQRWFRGGSEVVQRGAEVVQRGSEVVQRGAYAKHSNRNKGPVPCPGHSATTEPRPAAPAQAPAAGVVLGGTPINAPTKECQGYRPDE